MFVCFTSKEGDPLPCNNIGEKSVEKGESQEKSRRYVNVTVLAQEIGPLRDINPHNNHLLI